jgi:hypothetical protein
MTQTATPYISDTKNWLEKVVIGLNLCPFAKQPYTLDRIRYVVEQSDQLAELSSTLIKELQFLVDESPSTTATTLIIHPHLLNDFFDYNDYLSVVDKILSDNSFEGEIQVASFHPHYQFAGTREDDIENYTNRSPYPMLHLIREAQLERVLEQYENPEMIPVNNVERLKKLGHLGFEKIWTNKR